MGGDGAAAGRGRGPHLRACLLFWHVVISTIGSSNAESIGAAWRRPWSIGGSRTAASASPARRGGSWGAARPCCFSLPPSVAKSPPSTSAPASPIVASLFFRWKRRPRRSMLPAPRGAPAKDAPPSSFYLETLSIEPDLHLVEQSDGLAVPAESLHLGEACASPPVLDEGEGQAESTVESANQDDSNEEPAANNDDDDDDEKKIVIHTYHHTLQSAEATATSAANAAINNVHNDNNLTLMGVGMAQRQFASWVKYYLLHMTEDGEVRAKDSLAAHSGEIIEEGQILSRIETEEVDWESEWHDRVPTVRQFWKEGRLLCEHTTLLSNHGSSNEGEPPLNVNGAIEEELNEEELKAKQEEEERQMKSEQFRDTLGSYADRLASIVEDEMSDVHFLSPGLGEHSKPYNFGQVVDLPERDQANGADRVQQHPTHHLPKWTSQNGLRGWIEHEYGVEKTQQLLSDRLLKKSEKEQLETFQSFLDWFRSRFPYFHDRCDNCGVSCKDDPEPQSSAVSTHGTNGSEQSEAEEDDFSFLGYVYPTPAERLGNASRTELYRCRSCSSFTRFPRYNKALWVTSTQRGRCGEYSMLLYRMLRVLGYDKIRWVVDWADHVWVEVWLGDEVHGRGENGRWVHLDPCEAAVDNPLLYESWGKNQTFIVAFHDPFYSTSRDEATDLSFHTNPNGTEAAPKPPHVLFVEGKNHSSLFAPVEDITRQYTSDEEHVIRERRGIPEEPVVEAIDEVSRNMVRLLHRLVGSDAK